MLRKGGKMYSLFPIFIAIVVFCTASCTGQKDKEDKKAKAISKALATAQRDVAISEGVLHLFDIEPYIRDIDRESLLGVVRDRKEELERRDIQTIKTLMLIPSKEITRPRLADIILFELTIYEKPPLYFGPMPLKLIEGFEYIGGGPYHSKGRACFCSFEEWNIIYSPKSLIEIPKWAVALNNKGYILAKAKVLKIEIEKDLFKVLEIHYGAPYVPLYSGRTGPPSGPPIFKCESQYDFCTGFKKSETEIIGKKEREYFFIWHVGSSPF